jgi:ribosomal protein S1
MNEQLKKLKRGDVVLGKVIKIEPSKALIKIENCEPVYIIKEVASTQEIESIEEVLQLDKIYEFSIAIDYSARHYKYDEYYLSIADLEYLRSKDLNNIFQIDDEIKALVVWMDIYKERVAVSTKELEQEPGDMLKNPQLISKYRTKVESGDRKRVSWKVTTLLKMKPLWIMLTCSAMP